MPMKALQTPHVIAVVVSFHPDLRALARQLEALVPQVAQVIVVDNGSSLAAGESILSTVTNAGGECHFEERNLGLASAQCIGIQKALSLGASHILLLDQDSLPAEDMVARLLNALDELTARGERVAGVGPQLVSARDGTATPFVRFRPWQVEKIPCNDGCARIRTDFLVASGMLSPATIYQAVGLPEQGLFIDNIDLEWSFRAQSKGYCLYGICDAVLLHHLGDRTAYLLGLRHLGPIYIHNALRQYYQTRNRLYLYGRSYCPLAWKLQDFPRALFKLTYFSLLVPPRWQNARMMALGVWDALRGVMGPCRYEL